MISSRNPPLEKYLYFVVPVVFDECSFFHGTRAIDRTGKRFCAVETNFFQIRRLLHVLSSFQALLLCMSSKETGIIGIIKRLTLLVRESQYLKEVLFLVERIEFTSLYMVILEE